VNVSFDVKDDRTLTFRAPSVSGGYYDLKILSGDRTIDTLDFYVDDGGPVPEITIIRQVGFDLIKIEGSNFTNNNKVITNLGIITNAPLSSSGSIIINRQDLISLPFSQDLEGNEIIYPLSVQIENENGLGLEYFTIIKYII